MKYKFLGIILFLLLFFVGSHVKATTCGVRTPTEAIQGASVIFEGKYIGSSQANKESLRYYTFQVEKVYKGKLDKSIDLYFYENVSDKPRAFSELEELIIFADWNENSKRFSISSCTPLIEKHGPSIIGTKYQDTPELFSALKKYDASLAALDDLIKSYPENAWFHIHKAAMLEEANDYTQAANAYYKALFLIKEKMPEWTSSIKREAEEKYTLAYLKSLWETKQFEKILSEIPFALRPPTNFDHGFSQDGRALAEKYRNIAYLKLNRKNEINSLIGPDFSNLKLGKIQITGVSLGAADWSGSEVELDLEKSDLKRSNFSDARVGVISSETDFSNSNFKNAKLYGQLKNRIFFDSANFENALLNFTEVGEEISFNNANFQGATIGFLYTELPSDLKKSSFKNAEYDCNTVFPKGFDPKEAGMKQIEPCKKINQ